MQSIPGRFFQTASKARGVDMWALHREAQLLHCRSLQHVLVSLAGASCRAEQGSLGYRGLSGPSRRPSALVDTILQVREEDWRKTLYLWTDICGWGGREERGQESVCPRGEKKEGCT